MSLTPLDQYGKVLSAADVAAVIAAANLPSLADVQNAIANALSGAGLATSAEVAGVTAAVAAVGPGVTNSLLGVAAQLGMGHSTFSIGAGPTEGVVNSAIAGRKYRIYGFVAMLSGAGGNVTLRSGTTVGAPGNSNLSAVYPMLVGVPLPLVTNAAAGNLALWSTLDNEGILVSKPAAAACVGEVWWSADYV